jgi:hypothetical protein
MPSEYGEPWKIDPDIAGRMIAAGGQVGRLMMWWPEGQARAVACVNALAGMDPAALAGLVEAVEGVLSLFTGERHGATKVGKLRQALARLRGESRPAGNEGPPTYTQDDTRQMDPPFPAEPTHPPADPGAEEVER